MFIVLLILQYMSFGWAASAVKWLLTLLTCANAEPHLIGKYLSVQL
jgi:hypothetical protein